MTKWTSFLKKVISLTEHAVSWLQIHQFELMGLPAAHSQTAIANSEVNFLHLQTPTSSGSLFTAPGDASKVELFSVFTETHSPSVSSGKGVNIPPDDCPMLFLSYGYGRIGFDFKSIVKNLNNVSFTCAMWFMWLNCSWRLKPFQEQNQTVSRVENAETEALFQYLGNPLSIIFLKKGQHPDNIKCLHR